MRKEMFLEILSFLFLLAGCGRITSNAVDPAIQSLPMPEKNITVQDTASSKPYVVEQDFLNPDTVYNFLDTTYTAYKQNDAGGLCGFPTQLSKEIRTYFSAKAPDIYNKTFWSVAGLASIDKLKRVDCSLKDKRVAVIIFQEGYHIQDYLMYEKPVGGAWSLTGMATQNDRYLNDYGWCDYHIIVDDSGYNYWLEITTEVGHGTGLSIYNQIWYNPDGTEALQYEANGYTLLFCQQDEDDHWYSADMSYKSNFNLISDNNDTFVNVSYDESFDYPVSLIVPVYRAFDYAMYRWDPDLRRFIFVEDKSTLKPVNSTDGMSDWSMLVNKYSYRGSAMITSLDQWLDILKELAPHDR